jgi:hypothetical protein
MSGKRVLAVLTRSAAACQVKREHLCAATGGHGEAEREGASAASGCGGEGAGPEVPEGGSERGGGGRWGAEGRSEPFQGSHDRVGVGGLCPPAPERGRVWEPFQGSHVIVRW